MKYINNDYLNNTLVMNLLFLFKNLSIIARLVISKQNKLFQGKS